MKDSWVLSRILNEGPRPFNFFGIFDRNTNISPSNRSGGREDFVVGEKNETPFIVGHNRIYKDVVFHLPEQGDKILFFFPREKLVVKEAIMFFSGCHDDVILEAYLGKTKNYNNENCSVEYESEMIGTFEFGGEVEAGKVFINFNPTTENIIIDPTEHEVHFIEITSFTAVGIDCVMFHVEYERI